MILALIFLHCSYCCYSNCVFLFYSTGAACIESGVTIQGEKQRRGGRARVGRPQMQEDDPEMVVDDDPEVEKSAGPIEMDGSDSDEDVMDIENPNEF